MACRTSPIWCQPTSSSSCCGASPMRDSSASRPPPLSRRSGIPQMADHDAVMRGCARRAGRLRHRRWCRICVARGRDGRGPPGAGGIGAVSETSAVERPLLDRGESAALRAGAAGRAPTGRFPRAATSPCAPAALMRERSAPVPSPASAAALYQMAATEILVRVHRLGRRHPRAGAPAMVVGVARRVRSAPSPGTFTIPTARRSRTLRDARARHRGL